MKQDLIFDIGMHDGTDADFYLRKGFSVVAVEANKELCMRARNRFAQHVSTGRLVIINAIVGRDSGEMRFFRNLVNSQWSTTSMEWRRRNDILGTSSVEERVQSITLPELIGTYGCPYYLKIDIEGGDYEAIGTLKNVEDRPKFVSIEVSKFSILETFREFCLLERLGYTRFNIVAQHRVHQQRPPDPPLEGKYAHPNFEWASSGLFGCELPGSWQGKNLAFIGYLPVIARHRFVGDYAKARWRRTSTLLRRLLGEPGWHDVHAKRSS